MRSFLTGSGASFYVDMSDLQTKIDLLRSILTREQFERLIHRTFAETGRKAKTIIAKEAAQDYVATQKWVKSQVGHYRLTYGGSSPVTCTIPLSGHKGSIGGRFQAHKLKNGVSANIVRAGRSRLPKVMKNQGGNPPFLAGGMAFTRRTKERLPIVRVVGLGVPQMPLNRSADNVQDTLLEYAGNRLEHNFMFMLGKGG